MHIGKYSYSQSTIVTKSRKLSLLKGKDLADVDTVVDGSKNRSPASQRPMNYDGDETIVCFLARYVLCAAGAIIHDLCIVNFILANC